MPVRSRYAGLFLAAAAVVAAPIAGPRAGAEPTTAPTTPAGGSPYPSDERGFQDSAARCDDGQSVMEFGRTSRSLVAICVDADGELEYRAVRLSDQAALSLPATRGSDGSVIATNDEVTYSVSKDVFLVSEGDSVLYRDTWAEFHTPRFPATSSSAAPTSTPSSAAPTSTPPSAAPTTSVTVSTTTVTPSSQAAKSAG